MHEALPAVSLADRCAVPPPLAAPSQPHTENLTGTRGAFKTYSTTKPKYAAWEPKVAARQ